MSKKKNSDIATDIVKSLRRCATPSSCTGCSYAGVWHCEDALMNEAANKLEKFQSDANRNLIGSLVYWIDRLKSSKKFKNKE